MTFRKHLQKMPIVSWKIMLQGVPGKVKKKSNQNQINKPTQFKQQAWRKILLPDKKKKHQTNQRIMVIF